MKSKKILLVTSIVLAILVVAFGCAMGILKASNVLETDFSVFQLLFMIFTYGFGATVLIYGVIGKGGYEKAIGMILLDVAIVSTLIFVKAFWVITLVVAISLVLVTILLTFLFNASKLYVQRTNEKEDFKPYMEVLVEQKAEEKASEEPMPEIKSFKNNLK